MATEPEPELQSPPALQGEEDQAPHLTGQSEVQDAVEVPVSYTHLTLPTNREV